MPLKQRQSISMVFGIEETQHDGKTSSSMDTECTGKQVARSSLEGDGAHAHIFSKILPEYVQKRESVCVCV